MNMLRNILYTQYINVGVRFTIIQHTPIAENYEELFFLN